jgi:hypothetical protein
MAMTYSSLIASKGSSGSIATWVAYSLLDLPPIVDEAQSLVYGLLRCREMMTELSFSVPVNGSYIDLPDRFLDPIGRMKLTSFNTPIRHKDSGSLQQNRNYDELSGTLGANPFTTVASSNLVTVALDGSGFTQDSVFNTSGATAFNGAAINGTFPITDIAADGNSFTIDISILGTTPSASGAGGGSAVDYICDQLIAGIPQWWAIWNEQLKFDVAFSQQSLGKLQYYRSLPLLSTSNQSNFLTNRYPQLMRTACVTAAADFMKDDAEYQKGLTRLETLVQTISIENDGQLRGMELDPFIP